MASSTTQQQQQLFISKPKQEEETEDQTVEDEEVQQQQQEGEVVIGPDEDVVVSSAPTAVVLGCAALDDSRRLFQRLWTDEDEIKLLQGFLDYTTQRSSHNNNNNNNNNSGSNSSSYHNDTALFYEQIKDRFQSGFNKNQLVEKLRRLKKKYRNVVARISSGKDFSFKTLHDQASFEISRKIWGAEEATPAPAPASEDDDQRKPDLGDTKLMNCSDRDEDQKVVDVGHSANHKASSSAPSSRKRSRSRDGARADALPMPCNQSGSSCGINGGIEEAVMSCVSPLLKELLGWSTNSTSSSVSGELGIWGFFNPLAFNMLSGGGDVMVEEKWRKQRVLELEAYSKRVELVQEQVKLALEELRSING